MPDASVPKSTKGKRGRPVGGGSELDRYLKGFVRGKKYSWERYEFLEDYLIRCCGHSKRSANRLIAKIQAVGISEIYQDWMTGLAKWKDTCNREHASKAGKAKAKKYPKWSKERRQKFLIKKFEKLNKKEGLT